MDDRWRPDGTYENDFYRWANEQAALLREGRLAELDAENIAEEIASLARSEKRELASRLAVLLAHLLKWQFQPRWRGKSWRLSIDEQRDRVMEHLDENPSLRPLLNEAIARAYRHALRQVLKETPLSERDLPADCPYSEEQILDEAFLPQ